MVQQFYGACRFCGQVNSERRKEYETQEQADEYATQTCSCYDAKREQGIMMEKQKAEEDREQTIKRAEEQIENLFGSGATKYRLHSIEEETKELMLKAAILIYDEKLKDISLNITQCLKVKISKSAKGTLTFMRSDARVFKQEV